MSTDRDDFIIAIRSAFLKKGTQQKFSLFMITPSLAYPVSVSLMTFVVVLLTVLVLGGVASKIASLQSLKSLEGEF